MHRPRCAWSVQKTAGKNSPVKTEQMNLISSLLYGLFVSFVKNRCLRGSHFSSKFTVRQYCKIPDQRINCHVINYITLWGSIEIEKKYKLYMKKRINFNTVQNQNVPGWTTSWCYTDQVYENRNTTVTLYFFGMYYRNNMSQMHSLSANFLYITSKTPGLKYFDPKYLYTVCCLFSYLDQWWFYNYSGEFAVYAFHFVHITELTIMNILQIAFTVQDIYQLFLRR